MVISLLPPGWKKRGGWRGAYPELLHIGPWTRFMRRKTLSQRRFDIAVIIAIFLLLLCLLPLVRELVSDVPIISNRVRKKPRVPARGRLSPYREGRRVSQSVG